MGECGVMQPSSSLGLSFYFIQVKHRCIYELNKIKRWFYNYNRQITAKASGRILTAVIPSDVKVKDNGAPYSFVEGKVGLQHPKSMGQENQMWSWDPSTGIIRPYANCQHGEPVC